MNKPKMKRSAAVVGVGHTDWVADYAAVRQGRVRTDSEGYAVDAFNSALQDAGISKNEVDGLIVGPPLAYERTGEVLGMDVRWGGTGDAVTSVVQAVMAIECGLADVVALVYGNNQRSAGTQYGGPNAMGGDFALSYVYHSPWGLTSQGALYALLFEAYIKERSYDPALLGHVAVAERAWANLNPNAIMRDKSLDLQQYASAQFICEPLRLFDYCLINDGGVALIIAEADRARAISEKPVYIDGIGRYDLNRGATSLEPRVNEFYLSAQNKAGQASYDMAGVGPGDINLFSVYDSFSVHVPLALEGYGHCAVGEAERFLSEKGIGPGGALPTNTSGGHLSETYMQGWAHQIELVRQLRGEAGTRQVQNARHGQYTSDIAGKAFSVIYGN